MAPDGVEVPAAPVRVRWLAKAVARGAALKPLHDEDVEFAATRVQLASGERMAGWFVALKGVLLEGLEVWLVVVALSVARARVG